MNAPTFDDLPGLLPADDLITLHQIMISVGKYLRAACSSIATLTATLQLLEAQYARSVSATDAALTQLGFAVELKKALDKLQNELPGQAGGQPVVDNAPTRSRTDADQDLGAIDVAQLTGYHGPVIPSLLFHYDVPVAAPGPSYELEYPVNRNKNKNKKRKTTEPEETIESIHAAFGRVPDNGGAARNGNPTAIFPPIRSITFKNIK